LSMYTHDTLNVIANYPFDETIAVRIYPCCDNGYQRARPAEQKSDR
jgi:hypothetical protein